MEFAVYSLADPAAPTLLLNCPADVPFWSSIGYVHDVYVRGDTAYCNAGNGGLFVVDFSDINEPQMIGSLNTYVQSGYNHSGWLMQNAPYYAFADETHGTDVKITDVSDMGNIIVTDTIGSNVNPNSIPHNLIYADGFLYISYYFDGLYMFDCTISSKIGRIIRYFHGVACGRSLPWMLGCLSVFAIREYSCIRHANRPLGIWPQFGGKY